VIQRDPDGLFSGMSWEQFGAVSVLMETLGRADWRYDLRAGASKDCHQAALIELDTLAARFNGFTAEQRDYFCSTFYVGGMALDAIAKLLKAFKLFD
jgi:hypothetical protein